MNKSWLTSLFGLLAGVPMLLHQSGVTVGHLGGGDWLNLISAVGVAGLGLSAKDSNVTGGTVAQTTEAQKRV
jgi:hypothetical protein